MAFDPLEFESDARSWKADSAPLELRTDGRGEVGSAGARPAVCEVPRHALVERGASRHRMRLMPGRVDLTGHHTPPSGHPLPEGASVIPWRRPPTSTSTATI
jgi:hypothetical protein